MEQSVATFKDQRVVTIEINVGIPISYSLPDLPTECQPAWNEVSTYMTIEINVLTIEINVLLPILH